MIVALKKFFPWTMGLYLMRHYLLNFLIILIGLLSIIYLFDTVELLRRATNQRDVSISMVLIMGLYKLPLVGQLIFPFAILFSAMLSFWQLTRRHELVIVRSAGLSVWRFITPMLMAAFMIGLIKIMLINPLGALLISKYDSLESQYLDHSASVVQLSDQGLWLRQDYEAGKAILHASKIKMPDWKLENVIVFFFANNNDFLRRIDAPSASLDHGKWTFYQAVVNIPKAPPEKYTALNLSTNLTINELENSFADPETISFWKFGSYIKTMEETGFDTTSLHIFYQGLLSQPLLFMAMILLAAAVSLRPPRLHGTTALIMSGVVIGFGVFFASSFLQALGGSQQIPIAMAAWFPAIISFLLGIAVLMTLEDG